MSDENSGINTRVFSMCQYYLEIFLREYPYLLPIKNRFGMLRGSVGIVAILCTCPG